MTSTDRKNSLCCEAELIKPIKSIDHSSLEVFTNAECSSCKSQYVVNQPHDLEPYYDNTSGDLMRKKPNFFVKFGRDLLMKLEFKELFNVLPKGSTVLDLGCGDGSLVEVLSSRYLMAGADVYSSERWQLENPYYEIPNGQIFPITSVKFEAVTLRHVLEHVRDPYELLVKIQSLGINYVAIVVPNKSSRWAKAFGDYWYYWDPPRHLSNFTVSGLSNMALRSDWKIVEAKTHGIDEWIVSSWRRDMIAKQKDSPWKRPTGLASGLLSALSYPFGKGVIFMLLKNTAS